jgi:hypothetical protein
MVWAVVLLFVFETPVWVIAENGEASRQVKTKAGKNLFIWKQLALKIFAPFLFELEFFAAFHLNLHRNSKSCLSS